MLYKNEKIFNPSITSGQEIEKRLNGELGYKISEDFPFHTVQAEKDYVKIEKTIYAVSQEDILKTSFLLKEAYSKSLKIPNASLIVNYLSEAIRLLKL